MLFPPLREPVRSRESALRHRKIMTPDQADSAAVKRAAPEIATSDRPCRRSPANLRSGDDIQLTSHTRSSLKPPAHPELRLHTTNQQPPYTPILQLHLHQSSTVHPNSTQTIMSTTPTANTLLPPAVRVAKLLGTVGSAYVAGLCFLAHVYCIIPADHLKARTSPTQRTSSPR